MTLLETVKQFFDEDEWPYDENEEQSRLYTGFSTSDDLSWRCRAIADEERQMVIFFSHAPNNAPYETRPEMTEFLTRANYGLLIGNFEMDINNGEIRYKTSLDTRETTLTTAMIKNIVYNNVFTMKRYLPGIEAVIAGTNTPAEAILACETE